MFLKNLFSWLMTTIGFFVLLGGISLFIFSFLLSDLNSEQLYDLADRNMNSAINEKYEDIKKEMGVVDIKEEEKTQLIAYCAANNVDSPLCDQDYLAGRITQDEAVKNKLKEQMDVKTSLQNLESSIGSFRYFSDFAKPLYGVFMFLAGVLIIFIGKFFKIIPTLDTVAYEGAFASLISAVNFKVAPYLINKMVSAKIVSNGAASDLANVIPLSFLEWLRPAFDKVFMISIIMLVVFVVLYIIMMFFKKTVSVELTQ